MIKISDEDLLDIIFNLTHIKDEEGNDIPHFCFASDMAMDLDAKEEELAVVAIKNGYKIYKVFPGETMLGGLIILADGATLEPVETMYKEFYGEMPDIIKMELDDEDHLIEVEDKEIVEEVITENKELDLESQIRDILSIKDGSFTAADHPEPHLFEIGEPKPGDNPWWIKKFDDDEVDFGSLKIYERTPEEKKEGRYVATFMLTGGCNGSGSWVDYLDDLADLFKELKDKTGCDPLLYQVDTDICDDVWTGFVFMYDHRDNSIEESVSCLHEAFKNKKVKINKVGDPNAKAMWGRTRHRVELPKKGKGSFKRHPKHKLEEVWETPDKEGVDAFLALLKESGFVIESVKEQGFDDDAKNIHIQVYDATEFPHSSTDTAKAVYTANSEAVDARMNELADVIAKYDVDTENKYRITFDIGFGGTAKDGTDCTGRVSAGIDMHKIFIDPEAVDLDLGEDLDLEVYSLEDFIYNGEEEFKHSFEEGAESVGATIEFLDRVCPNRQDAFWYYGCVADIKFPKEGLGVEVYTSGESEFTVDGDRIREPQDLEEKDIYTDRQLYDADNEGRVDWDMNSWWDFRVYLLEDELKGEYGGDMGYDCMSDLTEALDVPGYMDVIADFKENWLKDLTESKKKKNPLKAAAKKHAKTDKKGAMGWFIHPNVEQSIQHFNHVSNGSAESTITAPAGLGEDLDLDVADRYEWEFDLVTAPKYKMVGYKYDEDRGYTGDKYWYARIPETCMKVSREDYKTNKLLTMPKNANVMKGVDEFFKAHPSAKYCVIGCKDISRYGKYVNAWRILLEDVENSLTEATDDYWVLSDGKNPRNSNVYSKIDNVDEFIADLESSKPQKYWELLHYVDGEPIRVWSTEDIPVKEDLEFDVMKAPKSPNNIRFEAHPREDFMQKRWHRYYNKYPEFVMPSNGKQIFKSLYQSGRYMLCKAAEKVVDKFFKDNPRNQYCVLLAFDKDNHPVTVGLGDEGLFGLQIPESINEAAEKHDTLNPKLWDESNNLKPEVREKILEIVKEFTDGLEEDEIKFKIDDIVLVGSNCSYNYNDKSDLDIHIRMDTDSLKCPDDLYPLLYSAYRSLFNNKMDINFYGIPVEIYVETSETEQMNEPLDKPEEL